MTVSESPVVADARTISKEQRRVLAGTMIGTTIEWYDFFIYANAVALVFAQLYFQPAGDGSVAQIVAFMSIGVSFLFRPLGAIIAGHLGDRVGRKALLVITLLSMGGATALMGLLPTYAQIGIWAPLLLVVLRIVQGLSTGGEWGAAAIMAVEHAPAKRRGFFGSFPQLGASAGMLLATGVLALLTGTLSAEDFLAWGWRIPFLFSIVLVVVGYIIRRSVSESPVFVEMTKSAARLRMPMVTLLRSHWRQVFQATWAYAGVNAAAYMVLGGYILNYGSKSLGMNATHILLMIAGVNVVWMFTTMWAGAISDRIGRVRTYQIGFISLIVWVFPMFMLIDTGSIWALGLALLGLAFGLGFAYGQQSAMYAEMFPASIRFSGASLSYALGSIIGGGFAPTIAAGLQSSTGWSGSIAIYLAIWALIALVVVSTIKDRTGAPLGVSVGSSSELK